MVSLIWCLGHEHDELDTYDPKVDGDCLRVYSSNNHNNDNGNDDPTMSFVWIFVLDPIRWYL